MARKKAEQKIEEQVVEVEIGQGEYVEQLEKKLKTTASELSQFKTKVENLEGALREEQELTGILRTEIDELRKGWKIEAILLGITVVCSVASLILRFI